jgi:uroporphyrinogen decarboxylase
MALSGRKPPYVPWQMGFTLEAEEKLLNYFGDHKKLDRALDNHFVEVAQFNHAFRDLGDGYIKDYFGVVWNRNVDKDIGIVEKPILENPAIDGYRLPDSRNPAFFLDIPRLLTEHSDQFSVFSIGFSLFERAWTLRGMENLLADFYLNPDFVKELLHSIADFNIAMATEALKHKIDAVYFGDDWGQQSGLIMGPAVWREFMYPELKRMYAAVKERGAHVMIHSCGDVDELFDDLIGIGLDCFNPFQPEVMDTFGLMDKYRGRLAFHGGLSTQKILPYGTVDDVVSETGKLLAAGARGGYIFAPAHAVEGDVPLENMLAMINTVQSQDGYTGKAAVKKGTQSPAVLRA